MQRSSAFARWFSVLSVGILVAATGIGAGDVAIAAYAGSNLGITILWAAVAGGILKFILNEGLAKWHIATGTTLLQGWIQRLPSIIAIYFGLYLIFWAFLVAGTMISFTGMITQTLFPLPMNEQYAIGMYGGLHSIVAALIIYFGGYNVVEQLMKFFIGLVFLIVVVSAILVQPDWGMVAYSSVVPRLPTDTDAVLLIFALIGGVGGSLTIMCYSYWLEEKQGSATTLQEVRTDLGVAYFLSALFGMAVIVIAAGVNPEDVSGYGLVISIADRLGVVLGTFGKYAFIIGFWGVVFSSMLGVWNGVPYLFADFVTQFKARKTTTATPKLSTNSIYYRVFLLYIALPPIILTVFEEPYWIAIAYSISGAFFMPFLAALLLYMNNRRTWVQHYKNGWMTNSVLIISLLLFVVLFISRLTSNL